VSAQRIPRILHQVFLSGEPPATWQALATTWKRHHPEWEYRLWDGDGCRALVRERYPHVEQAYDGFSFRIQRADAIRYLILHAFGGVYADLDVECLQPFEPLLGDAGFLAAYEPPQHEPSLGDTDVVSNAVLATVPGHPVMGAVVNGLLRTRRRIDVHTEVLASTGPLFLSRIVRVHRTADTRVEKPVVFCPTPNGSRELRTLMAGGAPAEALREKLRRRGAYAVHYWANTWVADLAGELHNPEPWEREGFRFFPGLDSPGFDLRNGGRDIPALAAECLADPRVVAFNTGGFVKYALLPRWRWPRSVENAGPGDGLYVRTELCTPWRLLVGWRPNSAQAHLDL
jgi:inositol phosphorylceramide mannosyltransferase catalytic subunit